MVRKEKNNTFSFDKVSIKNVEEYIKQGLSMKEAVRTELLKHLQEKELKYLFLSNCRFYENVNLTT
jgi:hypothetical protein